MSIEVLKSKLIKVIKNTFVNSQIRCIDDLEITVEEAKRILTEDYTAILLDVRSIAEYNEGHILGAIVVSDYEIEKNIIKVIANKEQTILTYCTSGIRSKKAVKTLRKLGYLKSYSIMGGLDNWC